MRDTFEFKKTRKITREKIFSLNKREREINYEM